MRTLPASLFRPTGKTVVETAIVFVAYVLLAKLGLMLDAVSGFATLLWAPAGVALAALLLRGNRLVPGIFFGALVVHVWMGAPIAVAFGIAVGSTAEALLGAFAIKRFSGFSASFDRLRHVVALIVPAAMVSTLVGATIAALCLTLGGVVPAEKSWAAFRAWWIGDMMGDLLVAPLLLTWATLTSADLRAFATSWRRLSEAIVLTAVLATACFAVFFRSTTVAANPFESTYVLFPLFAWAAVRFQLRGAAMATALAATISLWGTTRGLGPFTRHTLAIDLVHLQTFLGSAAFTPLVVGGAITERARAIRLQETFAAMVSHDLANPLGAIRISASALATSPAETMPARARKHDELVRRSVNRMTRILADLSDVAAIEAGHLTVERKDEDAAQLLKEASEVLEPLVTAKKQTLRIGLVDPMMIDCDRERVFQVLSNLVINAAKFSAEGSAIEINAERVERSVKLVVKDTGRGIDAAQLPHVFERYWRSKTSANGGRGLGLFIAKGIVEAHDGRLWAESKVGVGSSFYFTLPLAHDGSTVTKEIESHAT